MAKKWLNLITLISGREKKTEVKSIARCQMMIFGQKSSLWFKLDRDLFKGNWIDLYEAAALSKVCVWGLRCLFRMAEFISGHFWSPNASGSTHSDPDSGQFLPSDTYRHNGRPWNHLTCSQRFVQVCWRCSRRSSRIPLTTAKSSLIFPNLIPNLLYFVVLNLTPKWVVTF